MSRMFRALVAGLCLLAGSAVIADGAGAQEILPQERFASDRGHAANWQATNPSEKWAYERFVFWEQGSITYVRAEQNPAAIRTGVAVDPSWQALELSFRSRRQDIVPGSNAWEVPYAELNFRDAAGQPMLDWKSQIWLPTSSVQWQTVSRVYAVPPGAARAEVTLGYKAQSGSADFSSVTLTPVSLDRVDPSVGPESFKTLTADVADAPMLGDVVDVSQVTGAVIDESAIQSTLQVGPDSEYKTIRAAWDVAEQQLRQGIATRIAITPGVYREAEFTLDAREDKSLAQTLLVIEASEPGDVVITGSQASALSDWQAVAGPDGKPAYYVKDWPYDFGFSPGGWKHYNPRTPYEHRREQAFVNGQPLQQVLLERYDFTPVPADPKDSWRSLPFPPGTTTDSFVGVPQNVDAYGVYKYLGMTDPSELQPGSFGVAERDENGNKVYLRLPEGIDPATATVELAVKPHLMWFFSKSNVVLRGLTFEHSAGRIEAHKAVMFGHWYMPGSGWDARNILIDGCTFRFNNNNQLAFTHVENLTLRNTQSLYGAYGGLATYRVRNLLIENFETSFNHWRVQGGWASGGAKIHETVDVRIDGYTALGNRGDGLWFDITCGNVHIRNLFSAHNDEGIDWEISRGVLIENSVLAHNRKANLAIVSGMNTTVRNSVLFGECGIGQISFQAAKRDDANPSIAQMTGRSAPTPFQLDTLTLEGNIIAASAQPDDVPNNPAHDHVSVPGRVADLVHQHHGNPDLFTAFIDHGVTDRDNIWWSPQEKCFGFAKLYDGPAWREKPSVNHTLNFAEWSARVGSEGSRWQQPTFRDAGNYDLRPADAGSSQMGDLPVLDGAVLARLKAFLATNPYPSPTQSRVPSIAN